MSQTFIATMKGYKATNSQMQCNPTGSNRHQFELGKWYEVPEVKMCEKGFHFCISPSGVYSYYGHHTGMRVFECEAEQVLEVPTEAGADFKMVAKRIRLTKEITPGSQKPGNDGLYNTGDRNTGYRNTGNSNTGDRNTGYRNTGNSNTGDRNTGNSNTGYSNTGYSNTGYSNTGNSNTGDRNTGNSNTGYSNTGNSNTGYSNTGNSNTGDRNTGYSNTGNRNTGNRNTGNSNTGHWNATDHSSGFFCIAEPKVISFDYQTRLTHDQFLIKYPESNRLGELLLETAEINIEPFKKIPGITRKKLAALHAKVQAAKKDAK